MTFLAFPAALVAAGALALAVLLYALQRLRARRRVIASPAAALWRQAVGDAPPRALGGRFRDWPAYLLALGIALALWLAAAHPVAPVGAGGGNRIFYIDPSAALTRADEWARARAALLADVRAAAPDRRSVYLGDETGTLLLEPGESAALLAGRLDSVVPSPRPSRFADWIVSRGAGLPAGTAAQVRYYGGWPGARAAAARRPAAITIDYGYLAAAVPRNRGIVVLGASPAASGRWRDADVLVEAIGADGGRLGADMLAWTLDGRAFSPTRVERLETGALLLRDVPATGDVLAVRLRRRDAFPADDDAMLRLPDRRPVRVALAPGVPAVVRAVIGADDGMMLVEAARAQVVVRRAGERIGAGKPALILSAPSGQRSAFLIAGPGAAADGGLAARLDELGLARVDAAALADALHRPIAIDAMPAALRSIGVWADLFDPRAPFARSAAMPVFVSQALRWLGGADGWVPYAKAGAPLPDQSGLYGLPSGAGRAGREPPLAGPDAFPAGLTDRDVTAAADAGARPAIVPIARGPGDLPYAALLVLAAALLAVEWCLLQRGRMP